MGGLDLTGLGVRIARNADRLAGPLAGAGVRGRALAAHGKTATVADATVAVDGLQALEVALQFAAEVTLDEDAALADGVNDGAELLGCELLGAGVRIDVGTVEDAFRGLRSDAVDIGQRRFNALVAGNINSSRRGIFRILDFRVFDLRFWRPAAGIPSSGSYAPNPKSKIQNLKWL